MPYDVKLDSGILQNALRLASHWMQENGVDITPAEKTDAWYDAWIEGFLLGKAYGYYEMVANTMPVPDTLVKKIEPTSDDDDGEDADDSTE